ncbi:hypothetical protein [Synechococcus sp. CBW1004]|jgi:hypothetical protein|uniref:hypothetical protein n=1 Tax=Synechococcus sp. CBW1004 TaxID=1353136 RepID=UPI0018CEF485|nr:hypothetical protein [Synechococcus sp. CBW1004]QPN63590.1 hypothetical protein H8F25_01500 [Synechococcus sp. CBW1004]
MYRFRLSAPQVQLELVGNGPGPRLPFLVVGPTTEVAFVEELLEQELGSLTLNPAELFRFLETDSWIRDFFQAPELLEGDLESAEAEARRFSSFASQPLGNKLFQAGVFTMEQLDELLTAYRPFADTERFGEFLRLNMQVPPRLLELLLHPSLFDERGFNDMRLGERLVEMGFISTEQLERALAEHQQSGERIGEVLARQGLISATTARFFAEACINSSGQIDYEPI